MTYYYTALDAFAEGFNEEVMPWQKYKEWRRLSHLTELVSVDGMLNHPLVGPDYQNEKDWNYIITDGEYVTGFYSSLDYCVT